MSTIGKNIRKIRTVKKLSQAAFAELFNLARPSVGAYEEERAEPKIETVILIANHFGISIDSLLTKELTINELYKFDLHANELIRAKQGHKPKEKSIFKSVFIPAAHQMDYLVQLNNKDFIAKMPEIVLPGFDIKSMRAFELTTDEMHDQQQGMVNGDIVIGKLVHGQDYQKVKVGKIYFVVTSKEIIIRRVEKVGENLTLKADNSNVPLKVVAMQEIIEMWEAEGYVTKWINAPTLLSDRVIYLEDKFAKLEGRVALLEK